MKNNIKKIVVALSMVGCAGIAAAQQPLPRQISSTSSEQRAQDSQQNVSRDSKQTTVQDGIPVRPMPKWRKLASAETIESQSKQQYVQMMQKAQQQGALAPADHPQVQ
ncbi:MAG: hypothetical protein WKG03_09545, partial [Telluria sp.]